MKLLITFLLFLIRIECYCQDFELVPYRDNENWGFADSSGVIKIEPIYDKVTPFNRGYAAFRVQKKWGFIDLKGNEILKPKYDSVGNYFQGYYSNDEVTHEEFFITGLKVFLNGKEDFVDIQGKSKFGDEGPTRIFMVEEEEIGAFKDKVEILKKNDKVGFRIKDSGYSIEPQYDSLIYSDTDFESFDDELLLTFWL